MMYEYAEGLNINAHKTNAENCIQNSVVYTVFLEHKNLCWDRQNHGYDTETRNSDRIFFWKTCNIDVEMGGWR